MRGLLAATTAGVLALAGASAAAAQPAGGEAIPNVFRGTPFATADVTPSNERYGDPAHPDLSGLWSPPNGGIQRFDFNKTKIPLTPAYAAKLNAYRKLVDQGKPPADAITQCVAMGMRYMTNSFEIFQLPGYVLMVNNNMWNVRHIYLDGKGHTPDQEPTFNGDSVGRWDGDTLVVETTNMRPGILDQYGIPHSNKLSVAERLRRTAPNALQLVLTFTDPEAYTHPWSYTWDYRLQTPGTRLEENFCENNRNRAGADGLQDAR